MHLTMTPCTIQTTMLAMARCHQTNMWMMWVKITGVGLTARLRLTATGQHLDRTWTGCTFHAPSDTTYKRGDNLDMGTGTDSARKKEQQW